jgi:hypothetical protein
MRSLFPGRADISGALGTFPESGWPLEAELPGAGSDLRPDSLSGSLLGCSRIQARIPESRYGPDRIPLLISPVRQIATSHLVA